MNRHFLYLIYLAFLTSCSSILDTEPQDNLSDEAVIVDKRSAEAAVAGVYDGLQSYITASIIGLELAGDNVVNFNSQNNVVANKTSAGAGGGFPNIYTTINRANFVLNRVAALTDELISPSEKNKILGEAYFLRALAYFDLGKTFGGVPLVLEPATSPTAHMGVKRSTLQETYAQVLADLNQAENLLSNTVNRNRANQTSVFALKARLYLYTEQWELAEEYASRGITNSAFQLVKPYSRFFEEQNTTESIFEIAFSPSDRSSFYTNWLSPAQGGRHDYIPERSFAGLLLDPSLGGSRSSLLFRTPQGIYDLIQYGKQDGTSSIFVLRIAEQYLIRAEARARKNVSDLQGAVADLNIIKSRADVPSFQFSVNTTPQEVLLAIEHERRFELPFEGHRFVDIVRTGRAGDVFGAINPNLKNPDFWLFPIPFSELQKDPDLAQNPGY